MGTFNADILPNSSGLNLGSPTQRWDLYSQSTTVQNLASVRVADQYSGSDLGAKINAAFSDLGSIPGEVWVNQAAGLTCTTAVTVPAKSCLRFIQGGTYQTSQAFTLSQGASIVGLPASEGDGSNTTAVTIKQAASANLAAVIILGGEGARLSNVTIDGNQTSNASAFDNISIQGLRVTIDNVTTQNAKRHGISLFGDSIYPFDNAFAAPKLFRVMSLNNVGQALHAEFASDGWILQCEFENSTLDGCELYSCSGWRLVNCDFGGNTLKGLWIHGVSTGFSPSGHIIVGNQFGNNVQQDLYIDGWDSTNAAPSAYSNLATGNYFSGGTNRVSNAYSANYLKDGLRDLVQANTFQSNGTNTYKYAVEVNETALNRAGRQTIGNNVFGGTYGTGCFTTNSPNTVWDGNDEDGTISSLFTSPYFANNDTLQWKTSGGVKSSVIWMGNDDNIYINAPSGKSIFLQVNSSTVGSLGASGLTTLGKITNYDNIATVSNGIPAEIATVDLTGQGAAIGTTTLYAVPSSGAGQYRVVWNAKVTTVDGVSSTLGALTIAYTDPDGVAVTVTAPASVVAGTIATTSTGNTTGTALLGMPLILNCKASTNITYAFAYISNTPGQMKYNLHLKLECM